MRKIDFCCPGIAGSGAPEDFHGPDGRMAAGAENIGQTAFQDFVRQQFRRKEYFFVFPGGDGFYQAGNLVRVLFRKVAHGCLLEY